jgi:acetyl-CoA carboxylase biotin carboxyl carrier protein
VTQSANGLDGTPPSPERIADLVQSLATVMRQSDVTELDLELGLVTLRLRRPERHTEAGLSFPIENGLNTAPAAADTDHVITAPMVGTFYAAPTPSASPFVSAGDEIVAGQTIGIIEAMKIMNEIASDRTGVVQELLAENGQPVEYGSPLIRLAGRFETP